MFYIYIHICNISFKATESHQIIILEEYYQKQILQDTSIKGLYAFGKHRNLDTPLRELQYANEHIKGLPVLEEGMATHSSILAWKTPQTEETGGGGGVATAPGVAESDTAE